MTEPPGSDWRVRRLAYYAVMTATAIILSSVESLIPIPAPAPGLKLGLANIVTLILLIGNPNPAYAFAVTFMRCALSSIILGAFSALLFSVTGGLFSCAVMWMLIYLKSPFSPIGVSVAGASAHNMAQLAVAAALARDTALFGYLPIMLAAGGVAGVATGYAAMRIAGIIKIKM